MPLAASHGAILAGLIGGNFRKSLRDGGTLILISVILFAIFSSLLGGKSYLGVYWPILIILLGLGPISSLLSW